MFDLTGQVALVTGASRGIGRQIAEELALAGARVVLAARDHQALQSLSKELNGGGAQTLAAELDIGSDEQINRVVAQTLEEFQQLDILINNAGITRDGLMLRMKDEDWEDVISTNLTGVFKLTRRVLPTLIKQRYGRIINIVSVVAMTGNPGQVNYAASKAGLIGITKSLAREVASRGITVNAVAPGFIETDMTAALKERAREQMLASIPLGTAGTARDVALGVRFLASREAGYITGHVLHINGGMFM